MWNGCVEFRWGIKFFANFGDLQKDNIIKRKGYK